MLADAFKRIGLAERTGRGVDLIYQGLLRYGRRAPNFARSNSSSVVVELSCAAADLDFLRMVIEQENSMGSSMPLDSLLVLSHLRATRRSDMREVAALIQKDSGAARSVLERLVEAGLIQPHGVKRGRTYTLSQAIYQYLGKPEGYTRQAGFDRTQQEHMVLNYVAQHGRIRNQDVTHLCSTGRDQASRLLRRMVDSGKLVMRGGRRWAFYELAS